MPCLVLTGHPCAGKTTLAHMIAERSRNQPRFNITNVIIVNEGTACRGQSRQQCYATAQSEKATRGALKAGLDRALLGGGGGSDGGGGSGQSKSTTTHKDQKGNNNNNKESPQNTLVILDSLNYIKGFRYELYCLSREAQQQHGVVWVLNSVDVAKQWNLQRRQKEKKEEEEQQQSPVNQNDRTSTTGKSHDSLSNTRRGSTEEETNLTEESSSSSYSDELFEELVLRYEPPDERNRWDRPLFCIDVQPLSTKSSSAATKTMTTASTVSSRQALEKSVYNMHDLSAVLSNSSPNVENSPATATATTTTTADSSSVVLPTIQQSETTALQETITSTSSTTTTTTTTTPAVPSARKPIKARFKRAKKKTNTSIEIAATDKDDVSCNTDNAAFTNNDTTTTTTVVTSSSTTHSINKEGSHREEEEDAIASSEQPPPPEATTVEEQVDAMLEKFLQSTKPLQQGMSTQQHVAHANANLMHVLDTVTQQVCRAIVTAAASEAATAAVGGEFGSSSKSDSVEEMRSLQFPSSSSSSPSVSFQVDARLLELKDKAAERLQPWRRQYLQWCSTYPPSWAGSDALLAQAFCDYLQAQLADNDKNNNNDDDR